MFNALRWLERWLHQHIFKVGWLITKNFQTTTLFYYTFFLPGVVLYELVYWLVAGMLDVHAERAITWPEKQEIGELRLNFVKISPKASPLQVAVISVAPLLAGLVVISLIANNIFDITTTIIIMRDGSLDSISSGIHQVMATSDFWLWAYVVFAIGNTMMPDASAFKGWRWVVIIVVLLTVPLFLMGVGDEVVGSAVTGPIADMLNVLSTIFAVIIVADLVAVAMLATVETIIERVTGHSATFKNGKMIVMKRDDIIAQRKQTRQRERTARKRQRAAPSVKGTPSVYKLILPIPSAPGKEPVTTLAALVATRKKAEKKTNRRRREEPEVITTEATERATSTGQPGLPAPQSSTPFGSPTSTGETDAVGNDASSPVSEPSSFPGRRASREEPSDQLSVSENKLSPANEDDSPFPFAKARQTRPQSGDLRDMFADDDEDELTYEDVDDSP
jgi:hypothetical protein